MLLFAHLGIALGSCEAARLWLQRRREPATGSGTPPGRNAASPAVVSFATGCVRRRRPYIDLRPVLLGAVLPDLIDKTAAAFLFGSFLGSGRGLAHSLFFLAILALAGYMEYLKRRTFGIWLLAYGVLTHQLLDAMWAQPATFLWPLYGWSFPISAAPINFGWLLNILRSGMANPFVLLPELAGLIVILRFVLRLKKANATMGFVRHGSLPSNEH